MSVDSIRARLAAGGSRRPSMFRWMVQNHAELGEVIASQGRGVDWTAIADELGALGITGGRRKAPTAQMVRQTWWKAKKHAARHPPAVLRPLAGVVQEVAPAPVAGPAAPDGVGGDDPMARLRAQIDAGKRKLPKAIGGR